MVPMNLPRREQFKPENVFSVGLIPGPDEHKHNINSYLKPLFAELKILWHDWIDVNVDSTTKRVHAAF